VLPGWCPDWQPILLRAGRPQFFATTNQNPLVAVFGLPPAGRHSIAPKTAVELRVDIASVCSRDDRSEEAGFSTAKYRFILALQQGFGERFEFGLEIPYVMHREGFLDRLIIDWHDFFHLPQGERDDLPRDRLAYRVQAP
jgi:hypothetical protein